MRTILALIVVVLAAVAGLLIFSATPAIEMPASVTALGAATPVSVRIHAPHGVRRVAAWVEQNGTRYPVIETTQPARRILWQRNAPDTIFHFTAGAKSAAGLKDGPARLTVEAVSNDLRASTATASRDVTVVTRPPVLNVDGEQHYLYLGMADVVTFSASGYWTEAGVRVGNQRFRAWPMPGGKPGLFSLYAFAWNMPPEAEPVVYATNPAGNEATGAIVVRWPKKEQPHYRTRDMEIDDRFIQKVVNELDPGGTGEPVQRFLKLNGEMRRANNEALSALRLKTEAKFLWSQPFRQQRNSKVESNFADVRNYIYQGKKIDQQVHLGYDLSVTQHVAVEASNDGRVVYAAPMGIYGNCVVVDHGYGLQSIYGHLSQIAVHEGDLVKQGQPLGQSGQTGMAGGDHIHFSMQLDGVQIDPKEWWDAHWIRDHVARRVDLPGFKD